ncbi:MAG: hypothetical protein GY700_13435, partial [Propionibacteriaceae bacterium]|nr:hypothetical protein [Propionibacteriaceae bacterium]
ESFQHNWENIPDGVHLLTAMAYNRDGSPGQSAVVRLIAGNRDPVFVTDPVLVAAPGPHAHDADASDPDGDTVTYGLAQMPAGMTINAETGLVSWSPDVSQMGDHAVTITAADGFGGVGIQRFVIHVRQILPGNADPVITSAPTGSVFAEQSWRYDADAEDPDGDPPSYRLGTGPTGMTIDPGTGVVSWTPTAEDTGTHSATIFAEDGNGGVCGQQITVVVREPNDPPTAAILSPRESGILRVGDRVGVRVSADDPDGSVTHVDFFAGDSPMGTDDTEPFEAVWIPESVGETVLSAIAHDDDGMAGARETLTVNVLEATPDTEPPFVRCARHDCAIEGERSRDFKSFAGPIGGNRESEATAFP